MQSLTLHLAELCLRAVRRIPLEISNRLTPPINRLQVLRKARQHYTMRPSDVFIVTYPRSGTTWLQMILYQLTTTGQMDFFHISEFVPWFERCLELGISLDQASNPRIYKTHLPYRWIPKGECKYIYVVRNGMDVAVSYYYLEKNHTGYRGTFDEYFQRFLHGKVAFRSWFAHVRGWQENRANLPILYLTYEGLQEDLVATVERIAAFCHIDSDAEQLQRTVERASFAFMKRYEAQFGLERLLQWEKGIESSNFIRAGATGAGEQTLSPAQRQAFEQKYVETFGASYDDPEQLKATSTSPAAQLPQQADLRYKSVK